MGAQGQRNLGANVRMRRSDQVDMHKTVASNYTGVQATILTYVHYIQIRTQLWFARRACAS